MGSNQVNITIRSSVKAENGWEEVSVFCYDGIFREVNGAVHVVFEAADEDGRLTKTHMAIRKDCLEVTRHGDVESAMTFESGRTTKGHYRTEYGAVAFDIFTHIFARTQNGTDIKIRLRYDLCEGGEVLSENRVEILFQERPL